GGMYSNLVNQLKEAKALDRILEVMAELPRTRKDLGYPPLVTPTSQIVGIQAVMNVLFGRYKMVPAEVKGVAYGLYGKTPAPMDPKVQKIILKGYERGRLPSPCGLGRSWSRSGTRRWRPPRAWPRTTGTCSSTPSIPPPASAS